MWLGWVVLVVWVVGMGGGCDVVGGVVVWIGFVSRMRRVVVYGWLV